MLEWRLNSQDPALTSKDGHSIECVHASLLWASDFSSLRSGTALVCKGLLQEVLPLPNSTFCTQRLMGQRTKRYHACVSWISPAGSSGAEAWRTAGLRDELGCCSSGQRAAFSPPCMRTGWRDSDSGLAHVLCFQTGCTFINGAIELLKK